MKNFLSIALLTSSILSSTLALADKTDMHHGYVTCKGQSGKIAVSLTVGVFESGNTARFSYVNTSKPSDPWAFDIKPTDISEAYIGYQHLTFEYGHHNTGIKVVADGDIFGGSSEKANEATPYQGILFLQTGNDKPTKEKFNVTCKKTI